MKKLSKREEQIVFFLKNGFKNRAIALEVGIDEKTVSTYIQRVKIKLELDKDVNIYVVVVTFLKYKYGRKKSEK